MPVAVKRYADKLDSAFVAKAAKVAVPWGPLGYVTYKRTYARLREDLGRTEEWVETVERCVNAVLSYGGQFTKAEAERLFEYIYLLKCTPPGRMLWQLGTPTVEKIGGDSLNNCWVCSVESVDSFCFAFDELMLGGGVGFSIMPSHVYKLPQVRGPLTITRKDGVDVNFIVPDNREGWVELLRRVLISFFETGRGFSYSTHCIRSKGARIKGFGGVASGPEDLVVGIGRIVAILNARAGKHLRPVDALDIMNIIGSVVVSGNVRRSAQLALGAADDVDFLTAKTWDRGVPNWRAMSNNSVGRDKFDGLGEEFWSGYEGEGEPYGLVNLQLMRSHGRLRDGKDYRPDYAAIAPNPCTTGDTEVLTKEGYFRIKELVGKEVDVWNGEQWSKVTPRETGRDRDLLKIRLSDGRSLTCTPNHNWLLRPVGFMLDHRVQASDLKVGDILQNYPLPSVPGDSRYNADCYGEVSVTNIAPAGKAETVFCFTEPLAHRGTFNGIVTGQCAEQSLENFECCDLYELFLPRLRSREEFVTAAKFAYKVCKTVLQLPYSWPQTEAVVRKNQRMGISVSGFCQSDFAADDYDAVYRAVEALDKRYSKRIGANPSIKLTTVKPSGTVSLLPGVTPGVHPAYSRYYIRRIRFSANDPIIAACRAAGYHVEPQIGFDGEADHSTQIVSFPVDAGEKTLTAAEVSAVEQLEKQRFLQTHWSDNNVSVTVYYRKEELPGVKAWLAENYEDSVKTTSFLRHSDHGFRQAPYEEITKALYDDLAAKVRPLASLTDAQQWDLVDSMECGSGGCPIK